MSNYDIGEYKWHSGYNDSEKEIMTGWVDIINGSISVAVVVALQREG